MSIIKLPTGRDMVALLSEDFFREEVRCEYIVTELMKKVWAVNLDLYLEFARICEKNNLKYFAYAGTLLGAIRHQGFIPWDDDMDVCMPRSEYEKFLQIAPKELNEPYFLQTPFTDPCYFKTLARLTNVHTTRIPPFFKHSGESHGLMLDIFPLDDCNPSTHQSDMEEIRLSAKRCSQFMKRNDTDIMTPEHYASWKEFMTDDPMKEWNNVQRVAKRWQNKGMKYYSMKVLALSIGSRYNTPLMKSWFDKTISVKFEKTEVKAPFGYDDFLKATYGDYMQFPPKEKRGTWHSGALIDPERPYTDYL